METMFAFTNLKVYQKSMELVAEVYRLVKLFPSEEKYALSDQLRRAAISVPSNIAEGLGRSYQKETRHFINMAYGSLMEVFCQIEIAHSVGYIDVEERERINEQIVEIAKMLSGLTKKFSEE